VGQKSFLAGRSIAESPGKTCFFNPFLKEFSITKKDTKNIPVITGASEIHFPEASRDFSREN